MTRPKRTLVKARALVITPKGHAILAAIKRGDYRFAKNRDRISGRGAR